MQLVQLTISKSKPPRTSASEHQHASRASFDDNGDDAENYDNGGHEDGDAVDEGEMEEADYVEEGERQVEGEYDENGGDAEDTENVEDEAEMASAGEEATNDVYDDYPNDEGHNFDKNNLMTIDDNRLSDVTINGRDYDVRLRRKSASANEKRRLVVSEFDRLLIVCRSVGGHPSPRLSVFRGDINMTDKFTRYESVMYEGGRGFEIATPTVELVTTEVEPRFDWSGQSIRCITSVPYAPEFSASDEIELRVTCEYVTQSSQ